MDVRLAFSWGVCFSILVACGGGGGGSGTVGPGNLPVVNESMGGIWQGTSTSAGSSQSFLGVTTDDGRFRFLSLDTDGQFVGSLSVSNQNQISGSGVGVAPFGFTWTDGSVVTSINVSGTIAERNSFDGTWSAGTGESGTFNLTFDATYNRSSSLAKVAGNYTGYDDFGTATASISIDANGNITGQDIDGCIYGGAVSIINASFNVYNVSIQVSNCGTFNGTYTGLGGLLDYLGTDDEFLVSVDNGVIYAILAIFR